MRFYDREKEIEELERIYSLCGEKSHLTVIVGRRRVGKTRLTEEFMRDKPHIYFFVSKKSPALLLEEFSLAVRDFYGHSPVFSRWDDLFEYLFTHAEDRTVIALDEFQNFRFSSPEVFSILQKMYDMNKERGNIHLIALGSYISVMKRIFQDSKEPLFGRATEILNLMPLSPGTALSIAQDMGFSPEEGIILHSIFGGLPKYYVMLEEQGLKGKKIEEILRTSFFTDFPILRDEVKSMLIEDFGANYGTYFSILEAVSQGYNTFTTISDKTGIKRDSLPKYLQVLKNEFSLISSTAPVTKNPYRSKTTRYRISDNLIDFWFRFVSSQSPLIEAGNHRLALKRTLEGLPQFTSAKFEDIVREAVRRAFDYENVGSWWSRSGEEIDIVAVNFRKKTALFGEVKWRNRKMSCKYLKELERRASLAGFDDFERKYLLVSKSGFTDSCLEEMKKKGVMHWELSDVPGILRRESV